MSVSNAGKTQLHREQRSAIQWHSAGQLLLTWLGLRIFLSLVAVVSSVIQPETAIEESFPVWPATEPLGTWLHRVLLAPWLRWDVQYYLDIAARGYRLDDGTAQFHPLYPWLSRAVGWLFGGNMLAGLLVTSSLFALLSMFAMRHLAVLDLPDDAATWAAVFLVLNPAGFILFAPYSESLFLFCSIGALVLARHGKWWLAGLAGALATLTRQQGIFLLVPLGWELGHTMSWHWRTLRARWRDAAAVLLTVPAGFVAWIVYRGIALGDVAFDPSRPSTFIYSLLISRSSAQVVPIQGFLPPWEIFPATVESILTVAGGYTTFIDLVLGGLFLIVFIAGARFLWRLRPSYFLYSAIILAVSFSYYTGPYYPYMGLPRHALLAFPLVLPLAGASRQRPILRLALVVFAVILESAMTFLYVIGGWVP